jgi:hypothetical protein
MKFVTISANNIPGIDISIIILSGHAIEFNGSEFHYKYEK